jgi:hypothetical protein
MVDVIFQGFLMSRVVDMMDKTEAEEGRKSRVLHVFFLRALII